MSTYKSFADNINTTATATDTAAADDYYTCGLFGWRPRCLQRLATTRMFLLVFALLGVIQGANYTYMIASITTLEKRFQFGSKISGLILMTDNVMQLIANPLFGYLANRVHRPRMIALCQLIVVFGCYLAALPYFLYEYTPLNSYLIGGNFNTTSASGSGSGGHHQQLEYCDSVINNGNNTSAMGVMLNINDCGGDGVGADDISNDSAFYVSAAVLPAVIIFCLASCCNGIGFTAFYIIGIPFIDDNVNKKNSPIYISTTAALRLGGPTLGYFLSSFCLRFYENPFRDPGIDMRDPRWVGAWWLGFVILGTGVLLCLIPMLLFPRNFKSSPLMKRESYITLDNHTNDESDVWPTMQRLMSNPILICYTCGTTVNMFALFGYITFLGKYIESEYKRSASVANLFSGMIGVAPAALGIFFGGILIRQFKPGPKLLTTLIASVEIFGLIGLISAMFLGCPSGRLYGTLFDGQFDLQTQCNSQCRCTTKVYQPICGPDGRTNYFSPCYAGCSAPGSGQREDLSNCACFGSSLNRATLGSCRANRYCDDTFISFATMLSVGNFIGNLAKTGNSIIAFRIVDERDKSFALGLSGAFMNIFAFIPYPLVYGYLTDATCLIWGEACGQRGNCWLYEPEKFRYYLHGLTLGLLLVAAMFDIAVVVMSDRIKNLYNDDDDDDDDDTDGQLAIDGNTDTNCCRRHGTGVVRVVVDNNRTYNGQQQRQHKESSFGG